MASALVEDTIKRLEGRKGVQGVVVVHRDGRIIESTVAKDLRARYAALFIDLAKLAESTVTQLDEKDSLKFLRIRTAQHEFMVAPDNEFIMIVIQDPTSS